MAMIEGFNLDIEDIVLVRCQVKPRSERLNGIYAHMRNGEVLTLAEDDGYNSSFNAEVAILRALMSDDRFTMIAMDRGHVSNSQTNYQDNPYTIVRNDFLYVLNSEGESQYADYPNYSGIAIVVTGRAGTILLFPINPEQDFGVTTLAGRIQRGFETTNIITVYDRYEASSTLEAGEIIREEFPTHSRELQELLFIKIESIMSLGTSKIPPLAGQITARSVRAPMQSGTKEIEFEPKNVDIGAKIAELQPPIIEEGRGGAAQQITRFKDVLLP